MGTINLMFPYGNNKKIAFLTLLCSIVLHTMLHLTSNPNPNRISNPNFNPRFNKKL